jgi:hypothetical protein
MSYADFFDPNLDQAAAEHYVREHNLDVSDSAAWQRACEHAVQQRVGRTTGRPVGPLSASDQLQADVEKYLRENGLDPMRDRDWQRALAYAQQRQAARKAARARATYNPIHDQREAERYAADHNFDVANDDQWREAMDHAVDQRVEREYSA